MQRTAVPFWRPRADSKPRQVEGNPPAYDPDQDHVPDGTVADVLGWVGDDRHRAQVALTAENERTAPRVTLIGTLEQILAEVDDA